MSKFGRAAVVVAGAAALCAQTAQADVTAEDVWTDYKTYMESTGYSIETGSESKSGGLLTIENLTLSVPIPSDDADADPIGAMSFELEAMYFEEQGNGSVVISMPDTFDVPFAIEGHEDAMNMTVSIEAPDGRIVASGDPDETRYDFNFPLTRISTSDLVVDGEKQDFELQSEVIGYSGSYLVTEGETTSITGNLLNDSFTLQLNGVDPDNGGTVEMAMRGGTITGTLDMTVPKAFDPVNMQANLIAGMAMAGEYAIRDFDMRLTGAGAGDDFDINIGFEEGGVAFRMDEGGLGVNELFNGLSLVVSGSEIPLPQVTAQLGQMGFEFLMPVSKSDEPEDFTLGIRLVDLAVQEEIWAMFDPAGQLPHDPATIVLNTSGKANWFFDLFDPASQEMMNSDGTVPGEIHALTLNEILLSFAGASLEGEGDFTFDNSDLVSFDGMPRPQGLLNLSLTGGNALLDKLVAMGLIPDDQAMGARMMMGLFAVPGEGEDTLNSTIEINEQGHVLANGQRLK